MLNMLDTQDKLKNFSEQQLIQEMQRPSGSAPQFMVLGEIERRKRMRADAQRQEGLMQPTVAQEAVSAAGVPQQGIAQVAQSLAPQTDMTQNTGVPNVQAAGLPGQPNQPQRMADGGILRLAPGGSMSGGTLSAIANLKVMRPDLYEEYKDDPEALAEVAEYFNFPATDSEMTGLESVAAPREYDLVKRMFSDPTRGDIIDQQKRDAAEFGADYALDQRAQSLVNQRRAAAFGDDMLFDDPAGPEGKAREYLTGNVSAGRGGSAVPMPGPDQPFAEGLASLAAPERLPDPVISTPSMDVNPRAIDDASDFSSDPRRGEARRPVVPGMGDVLPTTSIANATADANRDDLLRYLRGEGPDADLPAVIDNAAGEDGGRFLFPRHLRNPDENLGNAGFLMFGDEAGASPRTDLNRRALAYMQSDMYTPPEQIYDLGPRGRLKYEEAGGEEFAAVSDRLAREDAADARTKEDAFFAAEDARLDAQRAADAAIDRRVGMDQPKDRAERVSDALADIIGSGIDYFNAPRDRDPVLGPFGGAEGTPEAEAIIAQNLQDQQDAGATTIAEQATTTTPAATKDTGGAGFGSMDSRIAQMLSNRQKEAESDKWMALAQTGMALMASKNPTFGGALGEAGLAGVGALQKSKQGARAFETDMLKLQTQLDIARQRARGSSKLAPASLVTAAATALKTAQSAYENASTDAERLAASDDLIAARTRYEQISNAVASQYPGIASALTSGGTGSGRKQV